MAPTISAWKSAEWEHPPAISAPDEQGILPLLAWTVRPTLSGYLSVTVKKACLQPERETGFQQRRMRPQTNKRRSEITAARLCFRPYAGRGAISGGSTMLTRGF